jgi:hypothetical protein
VTNNEAINEVIEELEYEIILAQRFGKPELVAGLGRAIEIASQFKSADPEDL